MRDADAEMERPGDHYTFGPIVSDVRPRKRRNESTPTCQHTGKGPCERMDRNPRNAKVKERERKEKEKRRRRQESRPAKKIKQSSIMRYMDTNGKRKRKRDQRTHNADEREESEQGNNQRDTGKAQRNEPNGKIDLRDPDQRDTDQRDTDQCDIKTKRKKETKEAIAKERTGIG